MLDGGAFGPDVEGQPLPFCGFIALALEVAILMKVDSQRFA